MIEALLTWQSRIRQALDAAPLTLNELEYVAAVIRAEQPIDLGLQHDDRTHASAIAASLGVQRSSASTMLKKLMDKGLIERLTCQYDSRAHHILSTEAGREAYRKSIELIDQALQDELDSVLTPADSQALQALLANAYILS
ncbi:MarR family winged helix-turn-helix transcriptional regulator [Salinibius halmophilus]|uniref:MarR family winged helix-turn-helix transcriptional regulator n=1 Tax=Salinibius halmophilus TaxID=1853216 RepID=UPI000E65FE87|nr:MarR family transcriptional regulator [Salinibius halmophilus]